MQHRRSTTTARRYSAGSSLLDPHEGRAARAARLAAADRRNVLVASTKVINAMAVVAVAIVLLALAVAHLRRGRRGLALRVLALVVGLGSAVAAVYLGWDAVQAGRRVPGWTNPIAGFNTEHVVGAPWDEWLPTLSATFGLSQDFFLQASLAGAGAVAVARGLSVLLTAAPFANLAVFEARDPRRLLGWSSLVGALAVPLVVQLIAYASSASYFLWVNSRYGMSLIPITVAALVLVAHARGWTKTSVGVAAVCGRPAGRGLPGRPLTTSGARAVTPHQRRRRTVRPAGAPQRRRGRASA